MDCSYWKLTLALGFFNHPLLCAERKGRRGSLFDSAKGPLPKGFFMGPEFGLQPKLYIPSTLNDLILWHTQLIVCAENVKSWFKS